MKLSTASDVPVYTISGASTARPLPDWLIRQRKRSLKQDAAFQNRVELLQDFEFEEASRCVRVSEDGEWIMSTGTYKPQIHCHQTSNLSLSFARHTSALNYKFILLSRDYSKSLHLMEDRKLEFHTPGGCHYETRLPRYGRDLIFDSRVAEALVPAVGVNASGSGEVYRLNLEVGRYMKPYQVEVGGDDFTSSGGGALQGGINTGSVNVAAVASDSHGLQAFGTSIGTIEFWDSRSKSRVAILNNQEQQVTALSFDHSGLSLATGSSTGIIKLFDLRNPNPLLRKDEGYGYPIQNLAHLVTASSEKKILSADKRIIKLWDQETGKAWTSVEATVDLHDVQHIDGSGFLVTANEGKAQHVFHIPQLGPAPRWASFVDRMVEEMAEDEDKSTEVYDNFKFLTLPELKQLGLADKIGTSILKPMMHGYLISSKLYERAKLIANPYVWEEDRSARISAKIEKERESRIRGQKAKVVPVNQKLVDRLLKKQERREVVDTERGVLGDARFNRLFEDEEFAVDEKSREFALHNPSTKINDNGTTVAVAPDGNDTSDSGSDNDEIRASNSVKRMAAPEMRISSSSYRKSGHQSRDKSLGSRAQSAPRVNRNRGDVNGERSVTFEPTVRKKESGIKFDQGVKKRRDDGRRSASNNTMRGRQQ